MSRDQRKTHGTRAKREYVDVRGTNRALDEAMKRMGVKYSARESMEYLYRRNRRRDIAPDLIEEDPE